MLTARHWSLAYAMRRDVRKAIVDLAAEVGLVKKTAVIGKLHDPSIRFTDEYDFHFIFIFYFICFSKP